jgi:ubiquinone/menaquinone biosynthesis C-methylase UbiE
VRLGAYPGERSRDDRESTLGRVNTQDPYRLIAGIYDRLIEPMQAGVRRVALSLIPAQPEWDVLDVGCATGTGLAPYAEAGCTIVGVDVSPSMLSKAADRLGDQAQLHLGDGKTLPFDSNRFDLVTTSMVVHEVPAPARGSFVAEMARVTKPDGRMLLIDFRFGRMRGWKGPTLRAASWAIERFSGHYQGYQSFKASGGVPDVVNSIGLTIQHEKIVAGGNIAIYVVQPDTQAP